MLCSDAFVAAQDLPSTVTWLAVHRVLERTRTLTPYAGQLASMRASNDSDTAISRALVVKLNDTDPKRDGNPVATIVSPALNHSCGIALPTQRRSSIGSSTNSIQRRKMGCESPAGVANVTEG